MPRGKGPAPRRGGGRGRVLPAVAHPGRRGGAAPARPHVPPQATSHCPANPSTVAGLPGRQPDRAFFQAPLHFAFLHLSSYELGTFDDSDI